MHIISWNVAGLSQTAHRIHDAYAPNEDTNNPTSNIGQKAFLKKKASGNTASAALHHYFSRHEADIMCLQEHKIPMAQLSSRSEPRGSSMVQGYESFWSCCVGKSQRGFNGVCTYAKIGIVKMANAAPLGEEDLDAQGRCVMTDHGHFVLFNVYVPALGGQGLSFRMRFLNALRRAMRHQREVRKKPVILVGDLNIAHTSLDRYWLDRLVHVDHMLEQVAHESDETLPQWKIDLAEHWQTIVSVMETKEVVSAQTTNVYTQEKFKKFRLLVTTAEKKKIFLGKYESTSDRCLWNYDLSESTYVDPDTSDICIATKKNVLSLGILMELMSRIVGVVWDQDTLRLIANTDAGVNNISPSIRWLTDVIEIDGMVDTFRNLYPTAEGRFTCWNQLTNRRYVNEGIRLDYTLVDKSLIENVEKGNVPSLRCCGSFQGDPLSENAALVAATANGGFQPASFEGEGIMAASQAILDTQFGKQHTGIIYTPPSFSDHVAVSLLLKSSFYPQNLTVNEKDAATRKSQPHKSQKSIASFFGTKNLDKAHLTKAPTIHTMKDTKGQSGTIRKQKKHSALFFAPRGAKPSTTKRSKHVKDLIQDP